MKATELTTTCVGPSRALEQRGQAAAEARVTVPPGVTRLEEPLTLGMPEGLTRG